MPIDVSELTETLVGVDTVQVFGRLRSVVGLTIQAEIPGVRLGELVWIERDDGGVLDAEVVGFRDNLVTLMPLGPTEGLSSDAVVRPSGGPLEVNVSDQCLGRVLDGLGRPIDGKPPIDGTPRCVNGAAPDPMARSPIDTILPLGVRAIDGLLTVGEGQRMGLFAGTGVGKSLLLAQIARQCSADVVVVCLVGERGRELREFLEAGLGEAGLKRAVVVCATSDAPPMVRMKCPYVATSIAESFRDQGKRVLLLMDSVTRFARAAREVGLAAGEAPVRRGFPPSVFAALPGLLERAGRTAAGSITGFYTVLVEGDDLEEPISDELRGILDGHLVLSRELAQRGHFPAIHISASLSRLMERLGDKDLLEAAQRLRGHLAVYEAKRDLVSLGAYQAGSDAQLDAALACMDEIEGFLRQGSDETVTFGKMKSALLKLG